LFIGNNVEQYARLYLVEEEIKKERFLVSQNEILLSLKRIQLYLRKNNK
jgi:hypothetical protein